MSEIPGDLKFLKSHEWARVEGNGRVTVGISDHAQGLLGDLVYVELPEVGATAKANEQIAVVESVKAASDVYSPVSGTIVEVNSALSDKPETINEDAYGEGWYNEFNKISSIYGLTVVANERFARSDTSVTGQALKIVAAKPDAVLVAGSGTPAALPQKALKERGFTGKMYQTHGVANNDFLRVCGKDCEGTFLPSGPMLVAKQLPASHPVKKSALEYVTKYEAQYGAGSVSTFGGHAWDAFQLVNAAATKALKKAKPGTPEFRAALREALEGTTNLPGAHGIFSMTKTDHLGLDQRAREMVQIVDGNWKWAPAK